MPYITKFKNQLSNIIGNYGDEFKLIFQTVKSTGDIFTPSSEIEVEYKVNESNPKGVLCYGEEILKENEIMRRDYIVTTDISFQLDNISLAVGTDTFTDVDSKTLIIFDTEITFSGETSLQDISDTINSSAPSNTESFIDENGNLCIISFKEDFSYDNFQRLSLDGTAISDLGFSTDEYNSAKPYINLFGNIYDILEVENSGVSNYIYVEKRI